MTTTTQPKQPGARHGFVGISVRRRQLFVVGVSLVFLAGCGSARPTAQGTSSTSASAPVSVSSSAVSASRSSSPGSADFSCTSANPYEATPGTAFRQSVALDGTQAVLTGRSVTEFGSPNGLQDGVLTVTQSGRTSARVVVTPPANVPAVELDAIGVGNSAGGSLCVVRFQAGETPVALLALTTGGAHCCTVIRAIEPTSTTATPKVIDRDFGDYGATLRSAGATALLVSADDSFAYAFSSFADSYPPVQIFTVGRNGYVDVTRAHPDLVRADLDKHWKAYTDPTASEHLGFLAGWLADKCLLDATRGAADAWAFVDQQNAAGKLTGPSQWPTGSAFIASLRALVKARGYCG